MLTELRENGTKKQTNVYKGEAVIAEQMSFPADAQHSTEWGFVNWKHGDPVSEVIIESGRGGRAGGQRAFAERGARTARREDTGRRPLRPDHPAARRAPYSWRQEENSKSYFSKFGNQERAHAVKLVSLRCA